MNLQNNRLLSDRILTSFGKSTNGYNYLLAPITTSSLGSIGYTAENYEDQDVAEVIKSRLIVLESKYSIKFYIPYIIETDDKIEIDYKECKAKDLNIILNFPNSNNLMIGPSQEFWNKIIYSANGNNFNTTQISGLLTTYANFKIYPMLIEFNIKDYNKFTEPGFLYTLIQGKYRTTNINLNISYPKGDFTPTLDLISGSTSNKKLIMKIYPTCYIGEVSND